MRIILLSAALLASGLACAATPVDGWYTGVFGGYTYLPNNVSNTTLGVLRNNSSYKDAYNLGARVGYQSNPMRYEAEYTYLNANTNYFNVNNILQTGVSGTATGNLIMANIYYDCPEMLPSVAPYLGAGIGYANLQTILNSTGPNGATFFKASDNEFAYQATLGLTYNFAENYAANLGYRYALTNSASNFGKVFQAHIANAGVMYRFDKGNYK